MLSKQILTLTLIMIAFSINFSLAKEPHWPDGRPDECTTIMVGSKASADGSVITSHTDDSHRTRAWMDIRHRAKHPAGSMKPMMMRVKEDSLPMPAYKHIKVGEIPQVRQTNKFINSAYPCMNEHQLAIGESTFGGRESLKSDSGFIDCQQLVELMLERCSTAREAIMMADTLTARYGWNDYGECLTIADKKEAWVFEITGAGAGNVGAIWVARRVPDGHITVNANSSRIRQVIPELDDHMASKNYKQVALDSNWWNPEDGEFEFCYAYDPDGRQTFSARRREWRVYDLLANSKGFHPNAENYPFSVEPDTLVTMEALVSVFKDYYEGTEFNFVKNITWVNDSGQVEISPLANPFMPYDMNKIFDINGGWGWRGERTIARWYTIYATITQSRQWLPDEIGGLVWLAWDNVASSIYTPVYIGTSDLPKPFKMPSRSTGFNRESSWWAFNRLGTLAAQRWGDMHKDLDAVWEPMQKEMFDNQNQFESEVLKLYRQDKAAAASRLTEYTFEWGMKTFHKAWELGDFLWTKYDEKF